MKLTLGSDPELMLVNGQGKIVSSIPVLKTDKNNPIKLRNGVKLYSDNVLAEIAHPPFRSAEEAVEKFRSIFLDVREFLGNSHALLAKAAHVYPPEELKEPAAREAGCNPNYDCYARGENPKVIFSGGLRTGSFHIHLGHDKLKTLEDRENAVKLLDIYVGCPSIVFDMDKSSPERRKYYGRAGEFRPTDYGVEWRVMGNYALRSPTLTRLVFDLVEHAAQRIEDGSWKEVLNLPKIQADTQVAINFNNKALAAQIINKSGISSKLVERIKAQKEVPDSIFQAWGLA